MASEGKDKVKRHNDLPPLAKAIAFRPQKVIKIWN
jgi:hypothetical protein